MNSDGMQKIKMIHLVVLLACILCNVIGVVEVFGIGFSSMTAAMAVVDVLNIVAMVFGLLYLRNEYQKSAAPYYKAFMTCMLVVYVFKSISGIFNFGMDIRTIGSMLCVVAVFLLAFGKDLGKQLTWILWAVLILDQIEKMIYGLGGIQNSTYLVNTNTLSIAISNLLTIGTMGLMIHGKYKDKESRGSH